MNRIFLTVCATFVAFASYAGGLLTNTNQNATFLRNPARDAAIAIDGVYSNPAGIAFMPEGFHFSLSWQAAWQKRQMNVENQLFMLNADNQNANRLYEGTATAPVIPSFQAAYVINDKWSVSAQFAVGGGGGKCEFTDGLPMFEELIGGTLFKAQATSYSLQQNLTGEQYFYGLQVGGTYKIMDKVSVFAGVRGVLANCSYTGAIKNVKANGMPASNYLNAVKAQVDAGIQQLEPYKEIEGYKEQYETLTAQSKTLAQGAYLLKDDFNLDCYQSGFGVTPIIGVDVNLGKLNLAAKYEFRTKINLENDSKNTTANVTALMPAYADGNKVRSDIPSLLTVGAQYSVLPSVRIAAGFHYYWDKDAKGTAIKNGNNTWEALLGAEWDINSKWLVSAGAQRTQYGFADTDMADTNFNNNSYGLCIGGAYKFNNRMKLNFGYMHSFYENHKFTNANGTACDYTRKNDVVGVSFDISF